MTMKKLFTNLLEQVKKSIYDRAEKVSSTRIQAYLTFGGILVTLFMYISVFLTNAVLSVFVLKSPYVPSSEEIIIFGMILGHHLTLLGIKNSGDKSLPTVLDKADKILQKKQDSNIKLHEEAISAELHNTAHCYEEEVVKSNKKDLPPGMQM